MLLKLCRINGRGVPRSVLTIDRTRGFASLLLAVDRT